MNLGLATEGRPQKIRAVERGSKDDGDVKKLLAVLAKLSLSNALQLQALRSILLVVHQVPTDDAYIQHAMQATKTYAEKARDMSSKEKEDVLGLPHIHVWNALLMVTMQRLEEKIKDKKDGSFEEMLAKLKHYADTYQDKGWRAINQEVKYARVQKNYKADMKRLEINIREGTPSAQVWDVIRMDLCSFADVKELPGVAPAGDLERQLQRFLDEA